MLDVGQEGVLLRFVEAVDFVDEHDGAAAHGAQPLGIRHHGLDLLDAAEDRAVSHELAVREARDEAGERGLPDAGRSPENDGAQSVSRSICTRRGLPGPEDVLLAGVFFERLGTHAVGKRPAFIGAGGFGRRRVEQAHGLSDL